MGPYRYATIAAVASLCLLRGLLAAIDYRDIVPLIFWPWFAWSCYMLVRRRRTKRAIAADETGPEPASPLVDRLPSTPPSPLLPATPPVVDEPAQLRPPDPPAATPSLLADPRTLGHEAPARSIFDAPDPRLPTTRQPISALVSGIQLPCDLTPMVEFERPIGAREAVAFVTRGFEAAQVGQAIGAELRRLGFELAPRHATEVVATRDDGALAVAVHGDAASVQRGGRPAFPGAGETGVVVELWTE